jgi:hypothetical protein
MKLATPTGATLGKSVQCKSPAVVWMIATGSAAGAGAALWTGGAVDDAACAAPSSEVEIIKKSVCNTVRMDAPIGYVGKPQLYDSRCTLLGSLHFAADPFGFAEYAQQIPP